MIIKIINYKIRRNSTGYFIALIAGGSDFIQSDSEIALLLNMELLEYNNLVKEYKGFEQYGCYFENVEDVKRFVNEIIMPTLMVNEFL